MTALASSRTGFVAPSFLLALLGQLITVGTFQTASISEQIELFHLPATVL